MKQDRQAQKQLKLENKDKFNYLTNKQLNEKCIGETKEYLTPADVSLKERRAKRIDNFDNKLEFETVLEPKLKEKTVYQIKSRRKTRDNPSTIKSSVL